MKTNNVSNSVEPVNGTTRARMWEPPSVPAPNTNNQQLKHQIPAVSTKVTEICAPSSEYPAALHHKDNVKFVLLQEALKKSTLQQGKRVIHRN